MTGRSTEKGSALVYILIAIALLAALTATFMDNSSQQTSSQNTFNTVTDLNSQINFIRSAIQECVLTYPEGDQTTAFAALTAPNPPYPILPTSTYFTGATPAVAANNNVANIRCPGNPGNSNNHALIFGGSSGKFLPPAPKLFGDWVYYNGADGVFFYTSSNKTDSYLSTAMKKLDDQFSECEADVINATAGAVNITSAGAGGPNCANGYTCFRVWVIANAPNIYPGDSDGDEAACP